jgi:MurNAc alpha-1-phosphate uridylyltransferase
MHAMILAAGRGERLRPLTDTLPKALVAVHGRPLIEWQVRRLVAAGYRELVINHAWLGSLIEDHLGSGERFGARIHYSPEPEALETLGGVIQALPFLGAGAFPVVSADIYTDFDYATLAPIAERLNRADALYDGHFVLVDNPPWHAAGDLALDTEGTVREAGTRLTYANISLYHPRLFEGLPREVKLKLFPWGFQYVAAGRISGSHFTGTWHNIGTSAELTAANASVPPSAGTGAPA